MLAWLGHPRPIWDNLWCSRSLTPAPVSPSGSGCWTVRWMDTPEFLMSDTMSLWSIWDTSWWFTARSSSLTYSCWQVSAGLPATKRPAQKYMYDSFCYTPWLHMWVDQLNFTWDDPSQPVVYCTYISCIRGEECLTVEQIQSWFACLDDRYRHPEPRGVGAAPRLAGALKAPAWGAEILQNRRTERESGRGKGEMNDIMCVLACGTNDCQATH